MKTLGAFIASAIGMALYILTVIFFIGFFGTLFSLITRGLTGRR